MRPLFMDEVNRYMLEDRMREHHAEIALQSHRNKGRSRAKMRNAFGLRLVRLGLRLVTSDPAATPNLVALNRH